MKIVRIPTDRVGVLIGRDGETKKLLEEKTKVRMNISSDGEVTLDDSGVEDPLMSLVAVDIVRAIGRGFSPERAFRLLEEDEYIETIDIRDFVGKKPNHVIRMRARLIGTKGKTRRIIEDLTGASISIYGNTVSIIANSVQMPIAKTAIEMILRGSEHATVYRYLERSRPYLRIAEMGFDY
ncbi:MAG: KH domain-containing protein [Methanomassiliicoccales archaeon]|jgi:ribosomal RNA assembly protein|nr:KH domain-containing protein [Methanomassiliicoccales archaeon]